MFKFKITDIGTGDDDATKVTKMVIKPGSNNTADWTNNIYGVRIHDGTDYITCSSTTITDNSITINIASGNLVIPDGTSKTITMSLYLKPTTLVVGAVLDFYIDYDSHGFEGGFVSTFGSSNIESNSTTIDIVATKLVFAVNKPQAQVFAATNFEVTVNAVDDAGNIDTDVNGSIITLALYSSSNGGTLSSSTGKIKTLTNGTYSWTDVQYNVGDVIKIEAQSLTYTNAVSNNITVTSLITGIDEYNKEKFICYPNPSNNGMFNISFSDDLTDNTTIQIYNTHGQLIYNEKINKISEGELKTIDISMYSKGIYFLKVNTNDKTYHNKIVVN